MDVAALAQLRDPARGIQLAVLLVVALSAMAFVVQAGWRIAREPAGQRMASLARLVAGILIWGMGWAFVGVILVSAMASPLFPQLLMWAALWTCNGTAVLAEPGVMHCVQPDASVVDITHRTTQLAGLACGALLMTPFLWGRLRRPPKPLKRRVTAERTAEGQARPARGHAQQVALTAVRRSYLEQLVRVLAAVVHVRQAARATLPAAQPGQRGAAGHAAHAQRGGAPGVAEQLRELQQLRAEGLVSAAEYKAKRADILSRL